MSTYNTANFKSLYGLVGSQFPDNTTQLITEAIMRQFGEDIADSFANLVSSFYLDAASIDTSGGTLTVNFASKAERLFYGSASFASAKAVALSNATNAKRFEFGFQVTNLAAKLTFPSGFLMNDVNWEVSNPQEWEPPYLGKYIIKASLINADWFMTIDGPYV